MHASVTGGEEEQNKQDEHMLGMLTSEVLMTDTHAEHEYEVVHTELIHDPPVSTRVKQLVEDVPQQLSWRRLFDGSFGPSVYERRRAKHCEGVFKNVMNAYRVGKAIGNYQLSKQMLSLAVVHELGGLYQSELCHEATRRRELNLLDDVRVLSATRTSAPSSSTGRSRASRSWRDAVLVAMDGETYTVMPKVVGARGRLTIDFQASQ